MNIKKEKNITGDRCKISDAREIPVETDAYKTLQDFCKDNPLNEKGDPLRAVVVNKKIIELLKDFC